MFHNYAMAAIRNLFRNRAYAAINLVGLAVGFAASILIALYVHDEYSYNQFIRDGDRIYQVGAFIRPPGGTPFSTSVTSSDIAPAMELDFPEVDLVTRVVTDGVRIGRDEKISLPIAVGWVDPNFLQMFQFKSFAGDMSTALNQPDGVVLTRHAALQLFGHELVVGKSLILNREHTMRVTAIIDDLPFSNTFNFDVLLPAIARFSPLTQYDAIANQTDVLKSENVHSFVRLRRRENIEDVQPRLRRFVNSHLTAKMNGTPIAQAYTFTLTPLTKVHFLPPSIGDMKPPADPRLMDTMTGIAILIILLAIGNFVSMMTARSARRAIEVGVRKAVGATRRQIMMQFMAECIFSSAFAMILAVIIVSIGLPAFNGFLQRDIQLTNLSNPTLVATLLGTTFLVGVMAGLYPALVLSRFRPSMVLKGIIVAPSRVSTIRHLFVVFQFGVLISLLVATITIHRQTQYAIDNRLRLPTEQIYFGSAGEHCQSALVNSVRELQGIRAASCVSQLALSMGHMSATFYLPDGKTADLSAAPIDVGFFSVFGIKPLSGRLLSTEHGADNVLMEAIETPVNPTVVINESAVHALGFDSPEKAVGQVRRWNRVEFDGVTIKLLDPVESEIVGVVPDFPISSVRDTIKPAAYYIDPKWLGYLVVKMDGDKIPGTLRAFNILWSGYDAANPFQGVFLNQYVNNLYHDVLRQATLFNIFTGITIAIASLGLLGLAIYTAERRTKEIGLRKVMGASRNDILGFLAWKFASPILWANIIAWPCAFFVMKHWLEGFAYHIDMTLFSFVLASLFAIFIAFATVVGHAVLAARAKPVEALRCE